MFRSIWSTELRAYRVAILGWGLGLALFGAIDFAESTPTTLAAFGSLAPLFHFLGDPYQIQTPEGFITWRILESLCQLPRHRLLAHLGRSTSGTRGERTWQHGCVASYTTITHAPCYSQN